MNIWRRKLLSKQVKKVLVPQSFLDMKRGFFFVKINSYICEK